MTRRWTRSLFERLRQRGRHAAFRIEPPFWAEPQRRRLASLLDDAAGVTSSLAASLSAAEAAALARSGDLDGAAAMLATVEAAGTADPAKLDLLARIRAQGGRLEEADLCWARVQAAHPEHPGAAAGRATIEAIRARRRPPPPWPGRLG